MIRQARPGMRRGLIPLVFVMIAFCGRWIPDETRGKRMLLDDINGIRRFYSRRKPPTVSKHAEERDVYPLLPGSSNGESAPEIPGI